MLSVLTRLKPKITLALAQRLVGFWRLLVRGGPIAPVGKRWRQGLVHPRPQLAGIGLASMLSFVAMGAAAQIGNLARDSGTNYVFGLDRAYELASLITPIKPEQRCGPYKRKRDYAYPQSVEPQIVASYGAIYAPYEGRYFDSMLDTTIEHIVALSEAHDSGMCGASRKQKRAFARDLDNLTLASAVVNQRKGGSDAAGWVPEHNRCWFATRVVAVKHKWGLSYDQLEADALRDILAQCDSTELQAAANETSASEYEATTSDTPAWEYETPTRDISAWEYERTARDNSARDYDTTYSNQATAIAGYDQATTASVQAASVSRNKRQVAFAPNRTQQAALNSGNSPALRQWDTNGNGQITCKEARQHGLATPVLNTHPAYQHMHDGDGDGMVCD